MFCIRHVSLAFIWFDLFEIVVTYTSHVANPVHLLVFVLCVILSKSSSDLIRLFVMTSVVLY